MKTHRALLTTLILLLAAEIGFAQQPTSLSLSANQGYAGVDSYTITVGNAVAGMWVDFEFSYGGSTSSFAVGPLDSSGTNAAAPFTLGHNSALGAYRYLRMRNHDQLTPWVELTANPAAVTYEILPPQPTSLSISPTTVTAGQGSYAITVGNGADIDLEMQFKRNGVAQPAVKWGVLSPVSQNSPNGQGSANVGVCDKPGLYEFTGLRNYLNVPWVPFSYPYPSVTIYAASGYYTPPSLAVASPPGGLLGRDILVTITGSHLCDAILSTTWPGLTFSADPPSPNRNAVTAWDGNSVTAIFHVAANAPLGLALVTLTSATGSVNFNFAVASESATAIPAREYIYFGGKLLAVDSGVQSTPGGAPSVPPNVSAQALSDSQIKVTWVDTSNETGYQVQRSQDGGQNYSTIDVDGDSTEYTHSPLSPGTTYYYRVRAFNSSGNSPLSAVVLATTDTSGPPATPSNLTASATSTSQIVLGWSDVSNNDGFRIYWNLTGTGGFNMIQLASPDAVSYTHSGLSAGTTYYYRISSYRGSNESVSSATVSELTNSNAAPSAPTGLTALATSAANVSVGWFHTGVGVDHYQIERSSNHGAYQSIGTSTTTSYSDNTVSGGVTYLYQVRAVGASGPPSTPSNIDLATTIMFLEDPLVAGTTPIRAQHFTELRQAVAAVRLAAGISTPSNTWTDNSLTGGVAVKALHVQELRDRLKDALDVLGLPEPNYTDPALATGVAIKKVHIEQIRQRVK